MKVPYQLLQVSGDCIITARGSNLHTFNLHDGAHLFSWRHPWVKSDEKGGNLVSRAENGASASTQNQPTSNAAHGSGEGPPSKRVKLDEAGRDSPSEEVPVDIQEETGGPHSAKASKIRNGQSSKAEDRPVINVLACTPDGCHVVTVTGVEKTIRVFEHDGIGKLKMLSERTMPKRPCSITFAPDNQTILSADKFGDVYSLPLIATAAPSDHVLSTPQAGAVPTQPLRLQADELTVHTKRNLIALEHQKKHVAPSTPKPDTSLPFAHTLLLGHVSMLTAVATAVSGGKPYIITADRDEHIRVSRGEPQAHVIETFCLGHEEFVSRLCVPARRQELLVSGGGDEDLFVWRWRDGTLLSKANLLEHVRRVAPEATRLAVSGLVACGEPGDICSIVAFCESIPALFVFRLTDDDSLQHSQTIILPNNPLDLAVVEHTVSAPRLLITLDTTSPESGAEKEQSLGSKNAMVVLVWDEARAWLADWSFVLYDSSLEDGVAALTADEAKALQGTLYTLEKLRKVEFGEIQDGDE